MKRRFKDYIITHDGMQWIVQKEYSGKDKNGNDKKMLTSKSYYGTVEGLCNHISNSELVTIFNANQKNIFDEIGIVLEQGE